MGAKVKAIFVVLILSLVFLHSKTSISAAGLCGFDLYQGHFTQCFAVNIGGQVVPEGGWDCGPTRQCFYSGDYNPCASAATSCDGQKYDLTKCMNYAGGNITWNGPSCVSQQQGCFIQSPGMVDQTGDPRGACVPAKVQQTFSCSNPPNLNCPTSTYKLCVPDTIQAGISAADCQCLESSPLLCFFKDQAALDSVKAPDSDQHCPICPTGTTLRYDAAHPKKGYCVGVSNTSPSYQTCSATQYCRKDGVGGCQTKVNECTDMGPSSSFSGSPCTGTTMLCSKGGRAYCCSGPAACTAAGGTGTTCLQVGALGGACENPYGSSCTVNNGVSTTNYCCTSQTTCTAIGGAGTKVDDSAVPFILCNQAAAADQEACRNCVGNGGDLSDPSNQGYWTAFGCVKTTKEGIVTSLIRIGIGISGGFVLLSILYGAFLLTTSSGDPKRVQEGQEMITSAIMGLLFVIFSVIILRFIGVSILQIPGFGT